MAGMAWSLPLLWAQATTGATGAPTPTGGGPTNTLSMLALRRWCGSVTLSSPDPTPSLAPLWAWLGGLAALLALAVVVQRPGRALRQLFDLPGNVRLALEAAGRLRRASRMLAVVVGMTVLSWTGSQAIAYNHAQGRDDVLRLTRARGLGELAIEQGVLAAITPLRDVAALGSEWPLLLVATILLFRASTDMLGPGPAGSVPRRPLTGWANVGWAAGASLLLYRLCCIGVGITDLPWGNCLMIESFLIPGVMAICDGMLLGWVLVELRNAGTPDPEGDVFDAAAPAELLPGTILAAVAALPARYLATFLLLALYHLPTQVSQSVVGVWIRWQLRSGLTDLQAAALVFAGLAGGVVWSRGDLASGLRGYLRLIRGEGGRLPVMFALAGLFSGVFSAVCYLALLSLPSSTWVLNAADSYAHYFSLPAGLWLLSALVEMGERSLPEAVLIPASTEE